MRKIKGIRELSKAVGRSPSTVTGWLNREDWPEGVSRTGPWSADEIDRVKAWMLDLAPASEKSSASAQLTKVKTLLALERQKLLKMQREIQEGKLHDALACKQRRLRVIIQMRNALEALPDALPLAAADKEIVRAAIERIFAQFAGGYAPPDERVPGATPPGQELAK